MQRVDVGILSTGEYERHRGLFDALEALLPVRFSSGREKPATAYVLLNGGREAALDAARGGTPCYATLAGAADIGPASDTLRFTVSAALTPWLRGVQLPEPERVDFVPLRCDAGDEVIATKDGQPLWIHRNGEPGTGPIDLVAVALPELQAGDYLADLFCRERFVRLLPLLHFLRRVTQGRTWDSAPLRACLVFDDPTLRADSYGYLKFSELAAHARTWNYHAAIATIPLSGRHVSAANAALFRESAPYVSLVIHGNDHVSDELTRDYSAEERVAILAQAWRRIEEMERLHSIQVGRIMEAPYGVIDEAMIEPMARLGYEATLITPRQFVDHNRTRGLPQTTGLCAAELLAGGLCLLPRIKLTRQWHTDVILAMLLNQPIIVVGHHYDAAGRLGLMKEIADTVNGLGDVHWASLVDIARSQYQLHRDADVLRVRLGSRRVRLDKPAGIRELVIERPWIDDGKTETLGVLAAGASISVPQANAVATVRPPAGDTIEIVSSVQAPIDPASVPPRPRRVWPMLRRVLMESRDRMYPYLRRPESGRAA